MKRLDLNWGFNGIWLWDCYKERNNEWYDNVIRLYFIVATQIAQVAQLIWIALAGQAGHQ